MNQSGATTHAQSWGGSFWSLESFLYKQVPLILMVFSVTYIIIKG